MSRFTPKRAAAFIVAFSTFAVILSQFGSNRSRQQRFSESIQSQSLTESPSAKAARIAMEERAKYIAKYFNSTGPKKSGSKAVALITLSDSGNLDSSVNTAIAKKLRGDSVELFTTFFKPAFVSDGFFDSLYDGSNEPVEKLELAKMLDVLFLGRESVSYSSDPSLENVITANMQLKIMSYNIATGESRSWTFEAIGAGFTQNEARLKADERLLGQLSKDTKLTLGF